MLFVVVVNVKMDSPGTEPTERVAALPATVSSHQDWSILFVLLVDVIQEQPIRIATTAATVLSQQDLIILFVALIHVHQEDI